MKKLLSLGLAFLISAVSFAMEDSSFGYSGKLVKLREANNIESVEDAIDYFEVDKLEKSLAQYSEYVYDQYSYINEKITLSEVQKLAELHKLIDSNLDRIHGWKTILNDRKNNVPKIEDIKKRYQEEKDVANLLLKLGVGGLFFAAMGFYSLFRYNDFFENHSAAGALVVCPSIFSMLGGGFLTICGFDQHKRNNKFLKKSEERIKKANDNSPKIQECLKNYNPHSNFDYDLFKKASGFAQMQLDRDMEMRTAKLKKYNSSGQPKEGL